MNFIRTLLIGNALNNQNFLLEHLLMLSSSIAREIACIDSLVWVSVSSGRLLMAMMGNMCTFTTIENFASLKVDMCLNICT